MADPLLLYLALFQARTYFGQRFALDVPGPEKYHLLGKILQLLQGRLDDERVAASDATMLVVSSLIMLEHDAGHGEVAKKHMAGLYRMVTLRGGVKALTHNQYRMQRKVCRVDLSVALKFEARPLFFSEDMMWQSFLTKSNLIRRRRASADNCSSLDGVLFELDIDDKLKSVWSDLREFSLLAELAYQTKGTLDPSLVNEAMISICYRLLHLSYTKNTVADFLRLALLVYSAHIFLPAQTFTGRYQHLVDGLREAFSEAARLLAPIPVSFQLWVAVMATVLYPPAMKDPVFASVIENALVLRSLRSWDDARALLKSVLWISFMHDQPGRATINPIIDSCVRGRSSGRSDHEKPHIET